MRTAFIVDSGLNNSLLRFTETKLFFDANNQGTKFVDAVKIVYHLDDAVELANREDNSVILYTGDFLTTNFRKKHVNTNGIIFATNDEDVIKFDSDTYVGFKKKCHYQQGTKQLYIIENLLKTCLRNKKLVYLDNTEDTDFEGIPDRDYQHLFGLASGWKTIELANHIGFHNLKTITVYDKNPTQLKYAQWLHSHKDIPEKIPEYENTCGNYSSSYLDREVWKKWHNFPVEFKEMDLFDTPRFPSHSLVWVSNAFLYEPTLFELGWQVCKNMHRLLIDSNPESVIITK